MPLRWRSRSRPGRPVERPAYTIADGLAITRPIPDALELVRAAVDEIVAVGDEALIAAMRLLIEKAGLVAEAVGGCGRRRSLGARRALPRGGRG